MSDFTSRFGLPNLHVAQAQKEITHNEALVQIDGLLHPSVDSTLDVPPAPAPSDAGKCWLVASGATGDWAGRDGTIAYWTGFGWRYLSPRRGTALWHVADAVTMRFDGAEWLAAVMPAPIAGGAVQDVEARQQLATLMGQLRAAGWLAA